jgi:hypothetical protein
MTRTERLAAEAKRVYGGNRPFVWMLVAALALRILTMVLYWPTVLQWVDGIRYLRIHIDFFGDPYAPAGYSAFLQAMHFITPNLGVTIFAQHLLGMVSATLLYMAMKRLGCVPWLALIPGALVLFSGDYLFLEHILMSETLFIVFLCASVYAVLRALDDPRARVWLGVSGATMILAALVRPITLEMPLVIGAWAFFVLGGSLKDRVFNALAAIVPAALVLVLYLIPASAIGPHAGLNEMTGWNLYARVAPFADCAKFTPPPGTRVLCETTPPDYRSGPFSYAWVPTSPGLAHFPLTPEGGQKPGEFAEAVLKAQPLDYAKAIVKDMLRYVDPEIGAGPERQYSGIPYALYQFEYLTPGLEEKIGRQIEQKGYTGVLPVHASGIEELETYQRLVHLEGLPLLLMAALAIAGIVLGRGRLRAAIVLLSLTVFLLLLMPVMTLSYDPRYAWPPAPLLLAAAVLGALVIYRRCATGSVSDPTT